MSSSGGGVHLHFLSSTGAKSVTYNELHGLVYIDDAYFTSEGNLKGQSDIPICKNAKASRSSTF